MTGPGRFSIRRRAAIAGLGAAFAIRTRPAAAAEVTLRYAGTLPTSHHNAIGQVRLAERVKELTAGAVEIQVFPAGQLYGARDIPTAVVSGGVDMGHNLTSVWSTDPVAEIPDLPFLFADAAHAERCWDPAGPLSRGFAAHVERRRMKLIHTMFFGSLFDFGNNLRLIRTPADLQGMKIRGYGRLSAEGLRALGASPIVMSPGEMYLAIQRGTIDGAITGVTSLESRKIWEVTKHATITGAAFGVMAVNISLARFNALKPAHQEALMKAGEEVFRWSVQESEARDQSSTKFLIDKGIETKVLTAEEKAAWAVGFAPAAKSWEDRASPEAKQLVEQVRALRTGA
jgi:TRAP-type C4-dicarboxylate transport system substrate-binding protein